MKRSLLPRSRPEDFARIVAQADPAKPAAAPQAEPEGDAAALATQEADIPKGAPLLLGTFGKPEEPGALVRLPSGEIERVSRGDRLLGRDVIAIDSAELVLVGPGGTERIHIPKAA